jgi:ferredoxin
MAIELDRLDPRAVAPDAEIDLTPLRRYWHPVADAADVTDAPVCEEQIAVVVDPGAATEEEIRFAAERCPAGAIYVDE